MTAEHGSAFPLADGNGNGAYGAMPCNGSGSPCCGVPNLYEYGLKYDALVYQGCESERFPTNMWYVGTRNERLFKVVDEVRMTLTELGTTDPSRLPPELQYKLVKRYVDFEIACKTAVSELGFDPTDLRQRTLAYRARKYNVDRMAVIRDEILAEDARKGLVRDGIELDALVKSKIKGENAHVTRLNDDLGHEGIDTSYEAQTRLTREWEAAFTNGRGQDFAHALSQLHAELDESQKEILNYFVVHRPVYDPRALSMEERYALAAEIDDVGVAGLSILNFFPSIDVDALVAERLRVRRERYNAQIIQYYYGVLGDMRLALEAMRLTKGNAYGMYGGDVSIGGCRAYQLHYLFDPGVAHAAPDVAKVYDGLQRYTPEAIIGDTPPLIDVNAWRHQ